MSNNDQTLIGYEKLSNLDSTYDFKPVRKCYTNKIFDV
jgi:hypothetical protein